MAPAALVRQSEDGEQPIDLKSFGASRMRDMPFVPVK
jgi:hypothetical protein